MAIPEIGAEGGSITVVARPGEGGVTEYSVRLRDQTLKFLKGDDGGGEIRRDTAWTDSWDEVVTALGRWPWPMLAPVSVQAEYAERILAAVLSYRGRDGRPANERGVRRWREASRGPTSRDRA